MRMKLRPDTEPDQTSLNMHSLIDIVFLLLVFFVMTLNIVDVEGDFAVRMPIQGESPTIDLELPLQLRLYADENGDLKSMTLNQLELGNDFNALQKQIVWLIGQTPEPGQKTPEVELDADYHLKYSNVIQAITAVSGYKKGDQVVKLINRIKFAKPRR